MFQIEVIRPQPLLLPGEAEGVAVDYLECHSDEWVLPLELALDTTVGVDGLKKLSEWGTVERNEHGEYRLVDMTRKDR